MSGLASSWFIHGVVQLLSLTGFMCLALAMIRHQEDLFGKALRPPVTRGLRGAGWLLLLLALWQAVAGMGWGFGLTAYSGHTSVAAGLVYVVLLIDNRIKERLPHQRRAMAKANKPSQREIRAP